MVVSHSRIGRFWDRLLAPPKKIRPMGLIAVQASINPFELFWLIAICIIGILYVIGYPPPSSVNRLLPDWAVRLWAANLTVGGLCSLFGGLNRRRLETGLAFYQFGWGLTGVATLVYGIALVVLFPKQGAYSFVTNLLWAAACFFRVLQVQRFFALSDRVLRHRLTLWRQANPLAAEALEEEEPQPEGEKP